MPTTHKIFSFSYSPYFMSSWWLQYSARIKEVSASMFAFRPVDAVPFLIYVTVLLQLRLGAGNTMHLALTYHYHSGSALWSTVSKVQLLLFKMFVLSNTATCKHVVGGKEKPLPINTKLTIKVKIFFKAYLWAYGKATEYIAWIQQILEWDTSNTRLQLRIWFFIRLT